MKSILIAAFVLAAYTSVTAQNLPAVVQPVSADDAAKLKPQDNYALPWAAIAEKNILWRSRVWRTVDTRDERNKALSNGVDIPAWQRLSDILITGVTEGKYKAYDPATDRFNKELTKQEVIAAISRKVDTVIMTDPTTNTSATKYVGHGLATETVTKFKIKEDWLYLKDEKKMVVRIVGIAPVRDVVVNGIVTEQPVCWFFYPDIREYLSQYKVHGKENENWDQVFVSRDFVSRIDKVKSTRTPQ